MRNWTTWAGLALFAVCMGSLRVKYVAPVAVPATVATVDTSGQ